MHVPLKIAVIEDHADLRQLFVGCLRGAGHDVAGFGNAEEFDEHLGSAGTDLLILDLNLPGESGYSIAARQRQARPDVHILMLTARAAIEDRIRGYASGADLYLVKPVAPAELLAVVGSVARRVADARARGMRLTLAQGSLTLRGPAGETGLAPAEALLLKALSEAPERTLDYWRLQELLHLEPDEKGKAALEVRISRLKKKLHDVGADEPAIKSLWKEGYRLCAPVRAVS
jgi:DNA-binding response OmpR family regulator